MLEPSHLEKMWWCFRNCHKSEKYRKITQHHWTYYRNNVWSGWGANVIKCRSLLRIMYNNLHVGMVLVSVGSWPCWTEREGQRQETGWFKWRGVRTWHKKSETEEDMKPDLTVQGTMANGDVEGWKRWRQKVSGRGQTDNLRTALSSAVLKNG